MNMISRWPDRDEPRLQIFVSDFSATGVVRNTVAIANEAVASGYRVRLLTCNPDGPFRAQISPLVAVVRLNSPDDAARPRRVQMRKALLAYRQHIRLWRPDVMLSAGNHGHLLSTLAWLGLPGRKVLRISNDLSHSSPSPLTRLWRSARFALMAALADQLVLVSRAQGKHPLLARQLAKGKARVISNGVEVDSVRAAAATPSDHPWLHDPAIPVVLGVGRHVAQKNFASLLRAFAVARSSQQMRLIFLGDGKPSELERMMSLATELGIEKEVDFVPAVENPFPYFRAAGVLALPSLWEGSANVLLEAMACGTPVVASRTAGDAEHVLGSGSFGLLVDPADVGQLASAILNQIGPSPVLPGTRAVSFSRANAMNRYMRLFGQLTGSRLQMGGVRVETSPVQI